MRDGRYACTSSSRLDLRVGPREREKAARARSSRGIAWTHRRAIMMRTTKEFRLGGRELGAGGVINSFDPAHGCIRISLLFRSLFSLNVRNEARG